MILKGVKKAFWWGFGLISIQSTQQIPTSFEDMAMLVKLGALSTIEGEPMHPQKCSCSKVNTQFWMEMANQRAI